VPSSFSHTLRSLEQRGSRVPWLTATAALFGLWCWWMARSSVTLYATSQTARVESTRMPQSVAGATAGRVVRLHLRLGQTVRPGDLMVELDSTLERAELEKKRQELASLGVRRQAILAQIAAEEERRLSRAEVNDLSVAQTKVRTERSRANAELQAKLSEIARNLREEQLSTAQEALSATNQAVSAKLEVADDELETQRLQALERYERRADLAKQGELQKELAFLDAQAQVLEAEIQAAKKRLQLFEVRAPVAGRIASVSEVRQGDVVAPGQVFAKILPLGKMHVVAEFFPSTSTGRIAPGQPARVRLDGFPWTRFGTLEAEVTQVASEPSDGLNRVELRFKSDAPSIPLQHGLTGHVDVLVGTATPWQLLLDTLGARVREPAPAADSRRTSPSE